MNAFISASAARTLSSTTATADAAVGDMGPPSVVLRPVLSDLSGRDCCRLLFVAVELSTVVVTTEVVAEPSFRRCLFLIGETGERGRDRVER